MHNDELELMFKKITNRIFVIEKKKLLVALNDDEQLTTVVIIKEHSKYFKFA